MSIVVFSGTTEGREISEYLTRNKIIHEVCVATESGELVMEKNEYANVNVGRLSANEIRKFVDEKKVDLVIDATHPYAKEVTDNLQMACKDLEVEYIRVGRTSSGNESEYATHKYDSTDLCARKLCLENGNILLTTGSKELHKFTEYSELIDRLYVRVLPSVQSIELCEKAGINEKNIIAMYGPHTKELNEAIIKQYNIKHLVTKDSGDNGGYIDKVEAAKSTNCKIHIIERPESINGISVNECVEIIKKKYSIDTVCLPKINAKLVGLGPGNVLLMTEATKLSLDEADYIFGARRMLDSYECRGIKIAEYFPSRIIENIEAIRKNETKDEINIVALFSGDTGIYSGATKLYDALKEWGQCSAVTVVPGISSFSAFAAIIGTDYQNAHLKSLHGKSGDKENIEQISQIIARREKIFLLMSGKSDFDILEGMLPKNVKVKIVIGYNISYDTQKILYSNSQSLNEDIRDIDEGLFIVLIDSGNNL